MRKNLNIFSLKNKTLGVASSCDLEFFTKHIRSQGIFKSVNYNFENGSSDDASIEILLPNNVISESDVVILSVAESTKKLIHPLIGRKDVDHERTFDEISSKISRVVDYLISLNKECSFIFKYPFNRSTLDINDRPWVKGSTSYWLDRLDRLYVDILSNCGNRIDLLDLDDVFMSHGSSSEFIRPELWGGHPEKKGAEILSNLFLERAVSRIDKGGKIKAIALDLDNTLWSGVFLESKTLPKLNGNRVAALYQHTQKGIPICIVSKNNPEDVDDIKAHLKSTVPGLFRNIVNYYVNWGPKSASIDKMAKDLGIGLSAIAFFDDSEFERGEVNFSIPDVKVYAETEIENSLRYAEFSFSSFSDDAKLRVEKYKDNSLRKSYEEVSLPQMPIRDYLISLRFKIYFYLAHVGDIDRIDELVQRTNQQNLLLNRTDRNEIKRYIDVGRCIMIRLEDKFGGYGSIGVVVYDQIGRAIILKELAISCRALGKGVEECIISFLKKGFMGASSLHFNAVRSYKNESFFKKLIDGGFDFDHLSGMMSLSIDRDAEYPDWFEVNDISISDGQLEASVPDVEL